MAGRWEVGTSTGQGERGQTTRPARVTGLVQTTNGKQPTAAAAGPAPAGAGAGGAVGPK